ncbi:hypothetical protein HPB51_028785 [Rhipicephalus microplus]|uniref:CCHC-type domain-containing protein n=1 Tax=Rhipicephalus microplus TaxID=6941 RepID=A0A9J6CWI3_RHIMP|nr:hypothetical protein HPB51_028785 [Rhipicephalus microplus]
MAKYFVGAQDGGNAAFAHLRTVLGQGVQEGIAVVRFAFLLIRDEAHDQKDFPIDAYGIRYLQIQSDDGTPYDMTQDGKLIPSSDSSRRRPRYSVSPRSEGLQDYFAFVAIRKPLKVLGVIQQVSGIGAYQKSHVWLLNMKTVEAKKALTDAGVIKVKDRVCLVIDPTRQEGKMKLHLLAFDVTKDAIRRAFYEYGDVKEVTDDRWTVEDFEGVESTTRVIRMQLRDGVSVDQLPHQVRISCTALVVVPGRPPLCLRCRCTGHMRRGCKVPRCSECHSFGHEQDECNRSYARAAGRRPETQQSELLMDEEESEQASLPATPQKQTTSDDTPVLKKSKRVSSAQDTNAGRTMGSQAAPTTSEQTRRSCKQRALKHRRPRPTLLRLL